jgi:DNA-directed RNA polymerase specialized sigma subunit
MTYRKNKLKKVSFISNSLSYSKEEIKGVLSEVIYFNFYNPLNFSNNDYKYDCYYINYEDYENKVNRFDSFVYIKTKYGYIKYKMQKRKKVVIDFYYKEELSETDLIECGKLIELHIAGYEYFESCDCKIFSNSIELI